MPKAIAKKAQPNRPTKIPNLNNNPAPFTDAPHCHIHSPRKRIGAPPKIDSYDQLLTEINNYFQYCDDTGHIPTITGIAFYLDMNHKTLLKYGSEQGTVNPLFVPLVKRAKDYVYMGYEQMLLTRSQVAGTIFAMKNHFGWRDQIDHKYEHTGTIDIKLSVDEIKEIQSRITVEASAQIE